MIDDVTLDALMSAAANGEPAAARVVADALRERGRPTDIRDARRIVAQLAGTWAGWAEAHRLLPSPDTDWDPASGDDLAREYIQRMRGEVGFRHGLAASIGLTFADAERESPARVAWPAFCRLLRRVAPSIASVTGRCNYPESWRQTPPWTFAGLRALPGLRRIHLEAVGASAPLDELTELPALEHVGVVGPRQLRRLVALGVATRLRSLEIKVAKPVRLRLEQFPRLLSLVLRGRIASVDAVADPRLESLDVDAWPSPHGLAAMPHLRELSVRQTAPTECISALRSCAALRVLRVTVNNLTERDASQLADLPLESLEVGIAGPCALQPVLRALRRARHLRRFVIATMPFESPCPVVEVEWLGDGWPTTELHEVELVGQRRVVGSGWPEVDTGEAHGGATDGSLSIDTASGGSPGPGRIVRFAHTGPLHPIDFADWPALRDLELFGGDSAWRSWSVGRLGKRLRHVSMYCGHKRGWRAALDEVRQTYPDVIAPERYGSRWTAYLEPPADYLGLLDR